MEEAQLVLGPRCPSGLAERLWQVASGSVSLEAALPRVQALAKDDAAMTVSVVRWSQEQGATVVLKTYHRSSMHPQRRLQVRMCRGLEWQ